ncbi:ETX/MTX2 family pore-forming toxin [Lactococcus ileimucosae]|uniref:ETX/MTX2 family pore-forming toxin n=1 Tax=Lactococcus ileimucosae TaxID=2941329 RepID=UPI003518FBAA
MILKKTRTILTGSLLLLGIALPLGNVGSRNVAAKDVNRPKSSGHLEKQSQGELNPKIDEKLEKLAIAHSYSMFATGQATGGTIGSAESKPINASDHPTLSMNSDMKLKEGEALAAHSSHFTNDTNNVQNIDTPSFSFETSDSITTTTTHSVNTGMSAQEHFLFPSIGGIGIAKVKFSVEYTYTTGYEKTKSKTIIWKVPSSSIRLEPHTKVQVDWFLRTTEASGTIKLQDKVKAQIPYKTDLETGAISTHGLGKVIASEDLLSNRYWNMFMKESRSNWQQVSNNTALYNMGSGSYHAKYGTELYFVVKEIEDDGTSGPVIYEAPVKAEAS